MPRRGDPARSPLWNLAATNIFGYSLSEALGLRDRNDDRVKSLLEEPADAQIFACSQASPVSPQPSLACQRMGVALAAMSDVERHITRESPFLSSTEYSSYRNHPPEIPGMQHQPGSFAPEARNVDTITVGSENTLLSGGLREGTDGLVRDPDRRGRRDLRLLRLDADLQVNAPRRENRSPGSNHPRFIAASSLLACME